MKRKAQLGNLQGIIVVLILVGILLAAGFFIFDEFQDQIDNDVNTVTAENSTTASAEVYINNTGYTVANEGANCFNTFVVTSAQNRSSAHSAINIVNITADANTGIITNSTDETFDNVTLSYTYQSGGTACLGIETTSIAMLTIPELLGLIVLIAVIGVILAVIFNVIPGAKTQGA